MKIRSRIHATTANILLRLFPLFTPDKVYIARRTVLRHGTEIGSGTRINGAAFVRGNGSLLIGNYCAMGHDIRFITSNHEVGSVAMQYQLQCRLGLSPVYAGRRNIKIGHGVWIGDRVMVMPGVTVGNGAVIGAGAIVTKNVDAYSLVAGCPAHRISDRFDGRVAAAIDSTAWWTWSEGRMKSASAFFGANFTALPVDDALQLIVEICGHTDHEAT